MPKRTQTPPPDDILRARTAGKTHNAADAFGHWHVTVADCAADYESDAGKRTRDRADQHVVIYGHGA